MEDGDNAKTGLENSYLRFSSHDARDVIKAAGLQGLSVYWHAILMSWCFSYAMKMVLKAVVNVRMKNKLGSGDDVLREVRENRLGKVYHRATFTERAMKNLWVLDNYVLAADYNVRVDELADVLHKSEADMIRELGEDGRIPMGLALVKLQQAVARASDMRDSMRRLVPYKPEPVVPMSEETKTYLEGIIKEMKIIRNKEKPDGHN